MWDLVRSVIMYVFVLALIVGIFKLIKTQTKVTIDNNDHTMEPIYTGGGQSIDTSVNKVSDLKPNDCVAYAVPGKPDTDRVAQVVAIEGQRVEVTNKVTVDGKDTPFTVDNRAWTFPETKVPCGCVFVLAVKSNESDDSMHVGPIPFFCIKGRLR